MTNARNRTVSHYSRWFALVLTALGVLAVQRTQAQSTTAEDKPTTPSKSGGVVLVIPLQGEVENGLYVVLNRALNQAEKAGADAIILDMNTPGGRVDSAIKIRDRLVQTKIKTYTYVNNMAISAGSFIALATDVIVMGPASNIGGALPIMVDPAGGAEAADKKFQSVFASEMRKTAKHKGHPVDIAEAFCNPDTIIEGLKKEGDILTLDYDQATSVGLAAYQAESLEAMLEREGFASARVQRFRSTWIDTVARWLSSPAIAGLLMMVGMIGVFIEIKTPGFGAPGITGLTALALYFFGAYLANLSGYIEIILFLVGLGLLIAEIYVIPGFGLPGIVGIALMVGSMFFGLFNLAPEGFDFDLTRIYYPSMTMAVVLVMFIPLIFFADFLFPHTPLYGHLALKPPVSPTAVAALTGAGSKPEFAAGMRGIASTDLRPSGTAMIEGRRADVFTEGDFIPRNQEIEILRVEGNRICVRSIPPA